MHIVRHCQRLTLRRGTGCRELTSLNTVVQSERTHIQERRQDTIDTIMAQVVQLPLADHRQTHHSYLDFIRFQRDIIAVEITAMIDILCYGIDYGIIACCIEFLLYNATTVRQGVINRSENLRSATQGIVRLHFVFKHFRLGMSGVIEFILAFLQTLASFA